MFRCAIALLSACLWAGTLSAQIYEWRDADGSRHFTTDVEDLPAEQRENPRIVVRQSAWPASAGESVATAPPLERRSEAQVVYDRPRRRARQPVVATAIATGGGVHIEGPLAVARVDAAPLLSGYVLPYDFAPLVTTSFDRGRSRHRTLRMHLQDQFQLDRDGPYLYERLGVLGPQFRSFLPRGLPSGCSRRGRVLIR